MCAVNWFANGDIFIIFSLIFLLQGDISSDYSPNKVPNPLAKSVSPPLAHRSAVLAQQRAQSSTSKLAKYQVPRHPEEVVLRQQGSSNKPILQRSSTSYGEHSTEEKKRENNVNGKTQAQT